MSDGVNYNLNEYVANKIKRLEESDRDLRSIFLLMSGEPEKLFAETNDGYAVSKITYGQFRERCEQMAGEIKVLMEGVPLGTMIGLYMNNCEEWLEIFWGLLICGYKPLLMNTRMSSVLLEEILVQYQVAAVISDGKDFTVKTIKLDFIKDELAKNKVSSIKAESDGWADEVILMSSGTTNNVKLCVYNGETFTYQISDSSRLIRKCKQIKQHYKGELKLLTFLPFYHVFGLVAVFMWFGFFSRSFVFLKDFSGDTILNTVRRHNVTHIFSIPLLWNTVYDTVLRTAKEQGQYEKLMKGISLCDKLGNASFLRKIITKLAFKSVREQLFGDSIKFMISGGSAISPDVMKFFNAVGYHLVDGYGMTEVGITSVELSKKWKYLTDRSVGSPFHSVEYKIAEDGELLVKGETLADIVMEGGKVVDKCTDGWFHTNDLAEEKDGRYYILGRKDDVIIGASGENINPDIIEDKLKITGAETVCLVQQKVNGNKLPVLIVRIKPYSTVEEMQEVIDNAGNELKRLGLDTVVAKIVLTKDALMGPDDFKLNRRKLSSLLEEEKLSICDPKCADDSLDEFTYGIAKVIAKIVGKNAEDIKPLDNLFYDVGVTSLDYFTVVMELSKEFGVAFPAEQEKTFSTVAEFAEYIEKMR